MASNYNFTEGGKVIPFEDAFIRVEQLQNELFGFGDGSSGQVGDNTLINRSTPRQEFTSSTNWKQVSNGGAHTAAIKTNGTLWCWGRGDFGQVGDNTNAYRSTPRQEFTSSTNWKQVACGAFHTVAIKTDGTLWTWGLNSAGQLGDNTLINRSTPRQEITSSTNWKQVACGQNHTAAIKTDGTLWVWGSNQFNQLGDNTGANRSTPRQEFTSSTIWKQVSAGYSTAAIKTDGTLWAWGYNETGQLGDNSFATKSTPIQEFTSSTNWKQVACGSFHTIAIKTDGTLWLWGRNNFGQLGDNTTDNRITARQEFTSSTNWKQASGGVGHTAAIKTDGTLWCWGDNAVGQLGINSILSRTTPVQEFTSSTTWKEVLSANNSTIAIKTDVFPRLY